MNDSYLTLGATSIYEHKESRSTFIAVAQHTSDADNAMDLIAELRKDYHDAAHIPFAYRLEPDGSVVRYSDDGEPGGSAGRPLHDALIKHSLTNVVISVVRYFGGVKLGVGGLKRAFFTAADSCLASAVKQEVLITQRLLLEFDYKFISAVMKLLEDTGSNVLSNLSSELCKLMVEIRLGNADDLRRKIVSVTNGSAAIEELNV